MKIRLLTGSFFLISFFTMKAQESFSSAIDYKTEPTSKIDFNETSVKVLFNKKSNSTTLTNTLEYAYLKVNYEPGSFKTLENLDQFNRLQNKLEIKHEFSNRTGLHFTVIPTINFQENLNISDLVLLGGFEIEQKFSSNTGIKIGVARAAIFGYPKFVPVLSINYKVNDKSTLSVGFPDSKFSYSNNSRNTFSLTNSFNGNFYNLDHTFTQVNDAAKVSTSQITSAFEYERNVDSNWFINFKAGYDFNKKYNLISNENHKVYDFNTGNGYVLGIGIKYKH